MIFEYFRHPDRVLPVIDRAHDLEDQRPTAADRREAARLDEARRARDPRVKISEDERGEDSCGLGRIAQSSSIERVGLFQQWRVKIQASR